MQVHEGSWGQFMAIYPQFNVNRGIKFPYFKNAAGSHGIPGLTKAPLGNPEKIVFPPRIVIGQAPPAVERWTDSIRGQRCIGRDQKSGRFPSVWENPDKTGLAHWKWHWKVAGAIFRRGPAREAIAAISR